ncbi:MAG: amino acid-binding ACT domain protein [Candidatus Thermoplasmatota archaeon]
MWEIRKHFKDHSAQQKVVKFFLETGLSVKDGEIYCNEVKMSPSRIGRVLDIDRRTVGAAVDTIESSEELSRIFSELKATAFYKEVAQNIDAGLIEIIPDDPHGVGILAGVAREISDFGISIRQCITEDPEFTEEAKLYVITESPVPGEVVDDIKDEEGVESVIVY